MIWPFKNSENNSNSNYLLEWLYIGYICRPMRAIMRHVSFIVVFSNLCIQCMHISCTFGILTWGNSTFHICLNKASLQHGCSVLAKVHYITKETMLIDNLNDYELWLCTQNIFRSKRYTYWISQFIVNYTTDLHFSINIWLPTRWR